MPEEETGDGCLMLFDNYTGARDQLAEWCLDGGEPGYVFGQMDASSEQYRDVVSDVLAYPEPARGLVSIYITRSGVEVTGFLGRLAK